MNEMNQQNKDNNNLTQSSMHLQQDISKNWKEKKKQATSQLEWNQTNEGTLSFGLRKDVDLKEEKDCARDMALHAATGSTDSEFATLIYSQCMISAGLDVFGSGGMAERRNAILNALTALKPQDEIEGMLISRLIALHFQYMAYLSKAVYNGQNTGAVDIDINRSTKLMRLFNETLEALNRYRRKGEQRFIVQHVNIEGGGKAIVAGAMEAGGGR